MVKTNKIHYYIDLDGVLANHDGQAQEYKVKMALQPNHDSGINYDISDYKDGFFRTMKPMPDVHLFQDYLKRIKLFRARASPIYNIVAFEESHDVDK